MTLSPHLTVILLSDSLNVLSSLSFSNYFFTLLTHSSLFRLWQHYWSHQTLRKLFLKKPTITERFFSNWHLKEEKIILSRFHHDHTRITHSFFNFQLLPPNCLLRNSDTDILSIDHLFISYPVFSFLRLRRKLRFLSILI